MEVAQKQSIVAGRETALLAGGYEQTLRAIGQALERQGFQSFEMTTVGNNFLVQHTNAPVPSRASFRALWDKLPSFNSDRRISGDDSDAAKSNLGFQYTLEEIHRLELEGRARRVDPHQTANASCVSQVLRCLGAYLNQKRARLSRLTRHDDTVHLEYVTSLGNPMKESFSANDLYDMWVRMYLQRAARARPSIGGSESEES